MSNYLTTDFFKQYLDDKQYVTKIDLEKGLADVLGAIEPRFQTIEKRLGNTATKDGIDRMINLLDESLKRDTNLSIDNAARDIQLARHETWINKIAHKTGTKLGY